MSDTYQNDQTTRTFTITLASLASSTTAGRVATAVDPFADASGVKPGDVIFGGKVTTGTSPTANKSINIRAAGGSQAPGSSPIMSGGVGTTDAAYTFNGEQDQLFRVHTITVDGTSDHTYEFGPFSCLKVFGFIPKSFSIEVDHDTGVNLNSTGGNHSVYYYVTGTHTA